jgi:hypothetical protein
MFEPIFNEAATEGYSIISASYGFILGDSGRLFFGVCSLDVTSHGFPFTPKNERFSFPLTG